MTMLRQVYHQYWLPVKNTDERIIHLYEHCYINIFEQFQTQHYGSPFNPIYNIVAQSFLHYIYLNIQCYNDTEKLIDNYIVHSDRIHIPDEIISRGIAEIETEQSTLYTVNNHAKLRREIDRLSQLKFIKQDDLSEVIYTPITPPTQAISTNTISTEKHRECFEIITANLVIPHSTAKDKIICQSIDDYLAQIIYSLLSSQIIYWHDHTITNKDDTIHLTYSYRTRRLPTHQAITPRLNAILRDGLRRVDLVRLTECLCSTIDSWTMINLYNNFNIMSGREYIIKSITPSALRNLFAKLTLTEVTRKALPDQEDVGTQTTYSLR